MVSDKWSTVITLLRNLTNPSELFATSHCVMEQARRKEICFVVQQRPHQYTLCIPEQCHLHNFHGIYGCQSEPAVKYSAFPCCCHVSWNFTDFQELQWRNSRTLKDTISFRGFSGPGKWKKKFPDFQAPVGTRQNCPFPWRIWTPI